MATNTVLCPGILYVGRSKHFSACSIHNCTQTHFAGNVVQLVGHFASSQRSQDSCISLVGGKRQDMPACLVTPVVLHRCKPTEFNPNGQLFFNPLVQAMRMIVHFGETLPEKITPEHIISSGLLLVWALCIFCGMLFCFGIGAATGQSSNLHCSKCFCRQGGADNTSVLLHVAQLACGCSIPPAPAAFALQPLCTCCNTKWTKEYMCCLRAFTPPYGFVI